MSYSSSAINDIFTVIIYFFVNNKILSKPI